MALTAAEKMRRRRQKLKDEGNYAKYKEKHREAAKKSRDKKKNEIDQMTPVEREKVRRQQRKRSRESVAKSRFNKKERSFKSQQYPYKSPCSLGKAVARAERALPKSPRKKQAVVKQLMKNIVPSQERNVVIQNYIGKNPMSSETLQIVKNFYIRDDISRQAPGMKDVVTVRNSDGKIKEQIRHLYNSVLETFSLFCNDHPDIKIGKSKFAALRPKHVFLSSKMPHNVCLCKLHENFISAIESFKKYCPEFPAYSSGFMKDFLCENATENCWQTSCNKCEKFFENGIESCFATSTSNMAEWNKWKDSEGKLTKVVEEGSLEDLGKYIVSMKKDFLLHCFIKNEQALAYQMQKGEVGSQSTDFTTALLQIDFAENYTCVAQDEIQSFHWVQPQVSLFTISSWYNGQHHPAVIVSNDLDHSKRSIIPYLDKIFEDFPESIILVNIWSDGPSSQFKNRFIAAAIPILENKFRKRIIWNFFATSHGKGPVDGIGGAVKRQVRNYVKARKGSVFNASDFKAAAERTGSDIKIIEMKCNEIEERNQNLNMCSIFEEALPLESIKKMHCIYVNQEKVTGALLTKKIRSSLAEQNLPTKPPKLSIKLGTYLLIKCLGKKQIFRYAAISQGEVEDDGEVKVMFLRKKNMNKKIFISDENDISYVTFENIIKILPDAVIKQSGSRFFYEFKEEIDVLEQR